MARGDVKHDLQVISAGSFLTIRPPAGGEEWALHTIYSTGPSELYITDGVNSILAESLIGVGGYIPNLTYRIRRDLYFQLKNTDTVSRELAYSGVQTADLSVTRVGSTVSELIVLAEGDAMGIGPGAGYEYEIQNILFGDSVRIVLIQGADTLTVASTAGAGVWRNIGFEIVSSGSGFVIQVINDSASNVVAGYTGIVTRTP